MSCVVQPVRVGNVCQAWTSKLNFTSYLVNNFLLYVLIYRPSEMTCMPKSRKRIRIDMEDADGARFDIKLEGNITQEKIRKVFEVMNMMDIEMDDDASNTQERLNMDSTGSKIWHVVERYFTMGKFKSTSVLEKYEDEFNEPVKLSVISTYLSRFSAKGKLDRVRTGREWTYQTAPLLSQKQHV